MLNAYASAIGAPPYDRSIIVTVLDNGVVVSSQDTQVGFADVDAFVAFLKTEVGERRKQIAASKANRDAQRSLAGGANAAEMATMVEGVARALDVPLDTIRQRLRDTFGIEPWQAGGSDDKE